MNIRAIVIVLVPWLFLAGLDFGPLRAEGVGAGKVKNGTKDAEYLAGSDYVNRSANLRLTVPPGWRIDEKRRKKAKAAGGLTSPDGRLSVLVHRDAFDGDWDRYADFLAERIGRGGKVETLERSQLYLDSKPALRLLLRSRSGEGSLRHIASAVAADDRVTLLLATAEDSLFDVARPTLEAITDSRRDLTRIAGRPGGVPVEANFPGGKVEPGKLIGQVQPIYPEAARRAGLSGLVRVKIQIDELGNVIFMDILEGHPAFHEAAMESVRQWAYSPTLLDGEPVTVWAVASVKFALR